MPINKFNHKLREQYMRVFNMYLSIINNISDEEVQTNAMYSVSILTNMLLIDTLLYTGDYELHAVLSTNSTVFDLIKINNNEINKVRINIICNPLKLIDVIKENFELHTQTTIPSKLSLISNIYQECLDLYKDHVTHSNKLHSMYASPVTHTADLNSVDTKVDFLYENYKLDELPSSCRIINHVPIIDTIKAREYSNIEDWITHREKNKPNTSYHISAENLETAQYLTETTYNLLKSIVCNRIDSLTIQHIADGTIKIYGDNTFILGHILDKYKEKLLTILNNLEIPYKEITV